MDTGKWLKDMGAQRADIISYRMNPPYENEYNSFIQDIGITTVTIGHPTGYVLSLKGVASLTLYRPEWPVERALEGTRYEDHFLKLRKLGEWRKEEEKSNPFEGTMLGEYNISSHNTPTADGGTATLNVWTANEQRIREIVDERINERLNPDRCGTCGKLRESGVSIDNKAYCFCRQCGMVSWK